MLYYEIHDILGDEDGWGRREIDIPEDTSAADALLACKRDFADCVARGDCNGLNRGAYIAKICDSWICDGCYSVYKHDATAAEKKAAKNIAAGYDTIDEAIADGKETIAYWDGQINAFCEILRESTNPNRDEINWEMEKFARAHISIALEKLMLNTAATKILLDKKSQK